ncbi:hypothetical protein GCM10020229_72500 [Kitasatospora albolonga]|uniref:acyl carrier protein n=1 Tax=Kitasatospora albolonga TaxID=68173 RepID=UPI0031E91458
MPAGTEETIHPAVATIVAGVAEVPLAEVTPDSTLREDLELDSLAMVELLAVVNERLSASIPQDEASSLVTVRDLAERVTAAAGPHPVQSGSLA